MNMLDQNEPPSFERDLACVINRYSKENDSNTPDFILAKFIEGCMASYAEALKARDKWFDFHPWGRIQTLQKPQSSDSAKAESPK